jgi:uncharacterized protein (TIGR00645 family)
MKFVEGVIEKVILASRWILVVFYLGLTLALAVYAFTFVRKLMEFLAHATDIDEADAVLKVLGLIDAALVASLVVMVIISSYENFVNQIAGEPAQASWLGKIDAGQLKVKVAATIVAISSIHLLEVFLNLDTIATTQVMWYTIVHLALVVSALAVAYVNKMSSSSH